MRLITRVVLAGVLVAASSTLAAGTGASAQVGDCSSLGAAHWGAFFGDGHNATNSDTTYTPQSVTFPDSSPVCQVGSSNSTVYFLLGDGTVWALGQGDKGELGDGRDVNSFTKTVQVKFPPGVEIAYLPTDAMPFDTAMAVDTNGNVWGWGLNQGGELCLGGTKAQPTPVQLPLSRVSALAGAKGHAVYDADGTVYSCGENGDGVLGDGNLKNSNVPVAVTGLPAGTGVTSLVSSWLNAGALLANGQYYDWGYDAAGQLGNGTTGTNSDVPVRVALFDSSPVTQVALGGSAPNNGQTLVMLADGSLYSWGSDSDSQLGDRGTANQPWPKQFFPPSGVTYVSLASGGYTSYGIDTNGTVWAWGANGEGQLGIGHRHKKTSPVPLAVEPNATGISSTALDVVVSVT